MIEMPDGGVGMTAEAKEALVKANQDVGKAATDNMVADRNNAVGLQAQQMAGAASQMQASAASGGFRITPDAAATLIAACKHSLQELEGINADLQTVSLAPPLGKTPGAGVVAPFTQQVATGGQGGHGMVETVKSLEQTLNQMIQAYQKASTNYQQTEQDVADAMKKLS